MIYKGYIIKETPRGFYYVMRNSNYALCSVDTVEQAMAKIDQLDGAL
jgi:hypothetical protein